MNVTLNANKFQTYNNQTNQYNNKNRYNQNNITFVGKATDEIGREVAAAARGSKIFEPFNKMYDNMTSWIAKNVISHVVNNKNVQKFADKFKNNDMLFNHMLATGSLITSGLYVKKTLDNKDMDKDRKNTLAINQVLTFGISTIGAYSMDKSLNKWWSKVTNRYVGMHINDKNFSSEYGKTLKAVAEKNKLIKEANKKLPKADRKLLEQAPRVNEYLEGYIKDKNISIPEKDLKSLSSRINGMGLLKKMVVFGLVYRFLVPVLVTPIANRLGDKMVQKRKAKEALEAQANQNQEIKKA